MRLSALALALFISGCGGSAQNDQDAQGPDLLKIDPPELVLRNFYRALDSDTPEAAEALLSERSKSSDPKSAGLIGNTRSLIQSNGGIAQFRKSRGAPTP